MRKALLSFALLAGALATTSAPAGPAYSQPELKPGPADRMNTDGFNRDRIAAAEEKRRRKAAKKTQ